MIREAIEEDAIILSELMSKTFVDTFGHTYVPEDLTNYLNATYTPEIQLRELKQENRITLLQFHDSQLAGYSMALLDSQEDGIDGPKPICQIQRFYLDKPFHGKGLAQALFQETMKRLLDKGAKTIWLGVWEDNFRAQRFYQNHGFVHVGEHSFLVGNAVDRDLLFRWVAP
ncbi:acetyltransferase, GNAT family [Gorgonomyces haynaldii]|nr:acetyltransferase, GNAT family [Gorgonomyces haynaldii]